MARSRARMIAMALAVGVAAIRLAAWLDFRYGWIAPAFDAVAHQFYEVPLLARLRRPSQLVLTRWHLAILSAYLTLGLAVGPWLSPARAGLADDLRRRLCPPRRRSGSAGATCRSSRAIAATTSRSRPRSSAARGRSSITSRASSPTTRPSAKAEASSTTGPLRSTPMCRAAGDADRRGLGRTILRSRGSPSPRRAASS